MTIIDNETGEVIDYTYFPPKERTRERPRLMVHTGSYTPTKQEFKDECDINVLMKRYQATGLVPQTLKPPFYGDFSAVPDFQEALNIVNEANALFGSLSSDVRKRFDNDPAKFLEFCNDPANGDELVSLGLRERPQAPPEPVQVHVVNQAPADAPGSN